MTIHRFLGIIILIFPFFAPLSLKAQDLFTDPPVETPTSSEKPTQSSPKLRVGFAGEEPAVIVSETGKLTGVSVEMWQALANKLNLDYEMVSYPSVPDALVHLGIGKIDIAIGSVTVTPERLELFDFTQPVVQEELTLLLPAAPPTLWSFVRPFLGWAFFSSAGLIYFCLFIVGNLLWLAEHKRNPQQFPPQYFKGVREGMWCATATFTTVGYGDRYPITRLGRVVAGWWSIISIVIITSLTAGIATTLALAFSHRSVSEFRQPEDLKNARIAVITGSNAAKWAKYYQARVIPVKNLSSAISELDNQQIDAILYSRLFLENYLHNHPRQSYQMANFSVGRENYGIALTQNNPLTQPLNEQLLNIDMQIKFQEIADNWFQIKNENSNNP